MVLVVGYYLYRQGYLFAQDKLWRLVPQSAAWVYAHSDLHTLWQTRLADHPLKEALSQYFVQQGAFYTALSAADTTPFNILLRQNRFMLSTHRFGTNKNGFVLYLALSESQHQAVQQLLAYLNQDQGFRRASRVFRGATINEIIAPTTNTRWVYVLDEDYLILSPESFLIEEVVRTIESRDVPDFLQAHPLLSKSNALNNQDGILYVDFTEQTHWLSAWQATVFDSFLPFAGTETQLDVVLDRKILTCNGYVLPTDTLSNLLRTFTRATPPEDPWAWLIPNQSTAARVYALDNPVVWNSACVNEEIPFTQDRLDWFAQHQIDLEAVFPAMKHLALSIDMSESIGIANTKLFVIQEKEAGAIFELWQQWAQKQTNQAPTEQHSNYTIHYLGIDNLPYLLFGQDFDGFSELFYAQRQGFILASSLRQVLTQALDALDNETTWGRTPAIQVQLQSALTDASYTHVINVNKHPALTNVLPDTDPSTVRLAIFQLQAQERGFFHQTLWHMPKQVNTTQAPPIDQTTLIAPTNNSPRYDLGVGVNFASPLISPPMVSYNPSAGQYEVFVQEEKNFTLYGLSEQGQIIFSQP